NSLSRLFTYFYKFDDKLLLFKHRRMPFPSLALGRTIYFALAIAEEILLLRGTSLKRLQRKARPSSW
ncbi:hypothetical protein ACVWYG_003075, partial [Pedobacter sp. UYEF25]